MRLYFEQFDDPAESYENNKFPLEDLEESASSNSYSVRRLAKQLIAKLLEVDDVKSLNRLVRTHHIDGVHSNDDESNRFTIYAPSESLSEAIHKLMHAKKTGLLDNDSFDGIGILYDGEHDIKEAFEIHVSLNIVPYKKIKRERYETVFL